MEKAWLDGRLVHSSTRVRYRADSSLVEKLALHTYHGGSGANFAPDHAQTIWCAGTPLRRCTWPRAGARWHPAATKAAARGRRLDDFELSEGECPPGSTARASAHASEEERDEDAEEEEEEAGADVAERDADAEEEEEEEAEAIVAELDVADGGDAAPDDEDEGVDGDEESDGEDGTDGVEQSSRKDGERGNSGGRGWKRSGVKARRSGSGGGRRRRWFGKGNRRWRFVRGWRVSSRRGRAARWRG